MSGAASGRAKRALLFDMGNTLVQYWQRHEFPGLLRQGLENVESTLAERGLLHVDPETVARRVKEEDHSAPDHRVRPLEGRLRRIYGLDDRDVSPELGTVLCSRFLAPMLARGRLYPEVLPTLRALRRRGIATAILSNTPWGSPAALWHDEMAHLGLDQAVDLIVFCDDVGWRKPAAPIFVYVLDRLALDPGDCLFVGDDPRWDVAGPQALGIDALLIDRWGAVGEQAASGPVIRNLNELWGVLGLQPPA
jgi:putative hydrolase of the HAD superfamily